MHAVIWPDHLLTLEEWDALPEDELVRFELVEGVLQVTPRLQYRHQKTSHRLAFALETALAGTAYAVVCEVDVVLIGDPRPTVRAPDVLIVPRSIDAAEPRRLTGHDVIVAIEIVSPGSGRTDRIAKLADYAEAGIPHYWILDTEGPLTLDVYELDGTAYRQIGPTRTGHVRLDTPVPVELDLGEP